MIVRPLRMRMGKAKLLTVDDTFLIEGRGVIVTPKIPVDAYSGACSRAVTLRTPDGRERTARASLDIPRVSPAPPSYYYLCLLADLTKDDVPIGTEVWIDDDVA